MSDTPAPPEPGSILWGNDLNAYLLSLEARIAANETRFDAQTAQLSALATRVDALEQEPDHIFSSAPWQFSSNLPPATGNQVRLDGTPETATLLDFRREDSDGADRTPWFQALTVGAILRLSDWNDSTISHQFSVTGPAILPDATNAHVPVVWDKGAGTLPNAKVNVGFVVTVSSL